MKSLDDSVKYLKGVGPARAELFEKLGVKTIKDVLYHFPRGYNDYTQTVSINDCIDNEINVIEGKIISKLMPAFIRKGMTIYRAVFTDDESDITIVIFNNKYLFDSLVTGKKYILAGKVTGTNARKEINSPVIISAETSARIQPQYSLTGGLTQYMLQNTVKNALAYLNNEIYEPLPQWIIHREKLCSLDFALNNIHLPKDMTTLQIARDRLVFDELLVLQLGMSMLKNQNKSCTGTVMHNVDISEFYNALPFKLTDCQVKAINECTQDMCRTNPMNRLVQGDVGSGKTAVAAACCFFAHKNNIQSALMAPTEILATQHYNTLSEFLNPLGVKCCLLKGSLTPKQKKLIKADIENGVYSVVVGTHALVSQSTVFNNLGLVITDEQHRFGVNQRATLALKGNNPHKLVMSATPIPRTLALIIYGDLDISVLDTLPSGRKKIETFAVTGKLRQRAYTFIKKQLDEGRQAYIVCPAIDDNEADLTAVISYYNNISTTSFKDYKIALLHGKMHNDEKDKVMADFYGHKIDILVSTTVVEVGVDVPNSTVMVIENADRFGLSQLHQLRGRVGRGKWQSYCILITDNVSDESKKRLKIMASISDGFKISEEDLKLRGPGDFFGDRQHGLPELKIADMSTDMEVLKNAQKIAKEITDKDNKLIAPENKGLKLLITKLFNDGNSATG